MIFYYQFSDRAELIYKYRKKKINLKSKNKKVEQINLLIQSFLSLLKNSTIPIPNIPIKASGLAVGTSKLG